VYCVCEGTGSAPCCAGTPCNAARTDLGVNFKGMLVSPQQSKLEKADILEMTVNFLQQLKLFFWMHVALSPPPGKYSTGYIQCMHEVHNMLLACNWTDKTLGSRLLNHLLRSLPRSAADERGPPRASPPRRLDVPHPGSPLGGDPQLQREGPTRQQRPALRSSHLGTLEMWRPW
uniref:Hairy-related 8.2 n=1 Tax=Cyclopterus lumpus TaxID=8103 RepID=A0A8C2XFR2_CYCLU